MSLSWEDAIQAVLRDHADPVHYTDIAEEIADRKLRQSDDLGANPAQNVAVTISNSLRNIQNSPFVRVSRGYYSLKSKPAIAGNAIDEVIDSAISPVSGIINALGMYWDREKVNWKSDSRILGRQQQSSEPVNFCDQIGIYFLHDNQGIVYVGRASDQSIGRRLYQHTFDRLKGRWDRFS